uniref:Uncharacterized protein n=1 Tax=Panagrolaimus sp. ES5 TaxID=591445 RepID=A0AC34FSP3_9BILA
MSSIEQAREHLVNEIDKRLHISRLTNGFYEKSSDILMKSAFGFLMDQWISAGLLPQDFRGEEDAKKKEVEEEKLEKKNEIKEKKKEMAEKQKKLKEFEEKFSQGLKDSGHETPASTSSTPSGSAPPEINAPEKKIEIEKDEEQEQILNDIDLEELFDEEAFESQKDSDKQLVKVEEESEKQIIPVDEIEETERQAQILKEQAQETLKKNAVEFEEAYKLQQHALLTAHDANVKTAKALVNQEIGTQLLAEAGAEMIEAGAHLQREALASERQVPVNIHQEATIVQGVTLNEASQEAATHAHEQVTFKQVEHIPPVY